ncbi:MAG: isoleucine--tRNA ligase, partial [Microbacterium sp.]|nr:isoleucine--tRNA ligase [Microbacterium sp.]
EVSSVANALRKREGKRVRLPLARLTVVRAQAADLAQFENILRDELNVKSVEPVELDGGAATSYGITHRLSVNARAAGPRLGKQVQQVIQAAKAGDWTEQDGQVVAGGIPLVPGEYDLALETTGRPEGEALALLSDGGFVLLDTTTTPELEAEGLARDVIRAVQDTRKAAGFDVSDRIRLQLLFSDHGDGNAVQSAFDTADVAGETLALEHAVLVDGHGVHVVSDTEPEIWQPAVFGTQPEHVVYVPKGTYANRGGFHVAVTRLEAAS